MQLASHELHDLHELTLSCVNSITNMALFINAAKDTELKSLIQKHFPYHVKDYNTKVEFITLPGDKISEFKAPDITNIIKNYLNSDTNITPVVPRTDISELNDREIATAYLLTLKRAGREYAWAAMECANPQLRTFLEEAFKMSSRHAYDIWQWMVKKGYYPLEAASAQSSGLVGSIYKPVEQSTVQ